MTSAPSNPFPLPFSRRGRRRSPASVEQARSIEIVAPDQLSTALLVEYATPLFPAELVSGTSWIVRLEPPPAEGRWVIELLSLVRRWLEATGLPCADVHYGGRKYVIRAATDMAA